MQNLRFPKTFLSKLIALFSGIFGPPSPQPHQILATLHYSLPAFHFLHGDFQGKYNPESNHKEYSEHKCSGIRSG